MSDSTSMFICYILELLRWSGDKQTLDLYYPTVKRAAEWQISVSVDYGVCVCVCVCGAAGGAVIWVMIRVVIWVVQWLARWLARWVVRWVVPWVVRWTRSSRPTAGRWSGRVARFDLFRCAWAHRRAIVGGVSCVPRPRLCRVPRADCSLHAGRIRNTLTRRPAQASDHLRHPRLHEVRAVVVQLGLPHHVVLTWA